VCRSHFVCERVMWQCTCADIAHRFSAKEPVNYGLFCGKRPATQGILHIFATLHAEWLMRLCRYRPHSAYAILHTGWRRCIGSLELQVSFRQRLANLRALSQKMTYEGKVSYDSTPLCTWMAGKKNHHLWWFFSPTHRPASLWEETCVFDSL